MQKYWIKNIKGAYICEVPEVKSFYVAIIAGIQHSLLNGDRQLLKDTAEVLKSQLLHDGHQDLYNRVKRNEDRETTLYDVAMIAATERASQPETQTTKRIQTMWIEKMKFLTSMECDNANLEILKSYKRGELLQPKDIIQLLDSQKPKSGIEEIERTINLMNDCVDPEASEETRKAFKRWVVNEVKLGHRINRDSIITEKTYCEDGRREYWQNIINTQKAEEIYPIVKQTIKENWSAFP